MFNEEYYVPILKWKRGEQKALELLPTELKEKFTPLIEIVPIPYDFAEDRPSKTIDQHLEDIGQKLSSSWGNERPIFLDLYWLDDSERMQDGTHPLRFILEEARREKINIIPVTGTERDVRYTQEIKKALSHDKLGVCIRLQDEDFIDLDTTLNTLLDDLSVSPSDVDLMIDFKYISPHDDSKNLISAITIIKALPNLNEWRNLILSSTAFPENLSGLPNDTISPIPRSEWKVWRTLREKKDRIGRLPIFSDYLIAHPEYIELDPRIIDRTVNIRYTAEKEWLISKGRSVKKYGGGQSHALSKRLVEHRQFCGKTFSWGDDYIYSCAEKTCGPGNAETWRRVATNHHLTFVVLQLASHTLT